MLGVVGRRLSSLKSGSLRGQPAAFVAAAGRPCLTADNISGPSDGSICSANRLFFIRSSFPDQMRGFSSGAIPPGQEVQETGFFSDTNNSGFWKKLDKTEKAYDGSGMGNISSMWDDLYGANNSLTDGMDQKLKKAATYFEFDPDEVAKEDYSFRPDANFPRNMTYDTKDLDLTKPGVRKPIRRGEFITTTEEVLLKADFRNVKFLANFITEAGVIEKRSKTGISAKAQRKIAREIKTARAFGLMPFTTMGTKQFVYGRTMEHESRDFEFDSYEHTFVDEDGGDA